MIAGAQVGEFHQIEPVDSADKLDVCLWRANPATFEYLFESDEAFHVAEGAATVELPGTGDRIDLRPGDVGYFRPPINLDDHAVIQEVHGDLELV